jgi:DNA-binding NarL/FixJ family response regulator
VKRFLLIDDHETFRLGMRQLIEADPQRKVVAEAGSVREGLRDLEAAAADVVVLDVSMPGGSGIVFLNELRRLKRLEKLLVVTMHAHAELAAEAFAAGATGFALKSDSADELRAAIDRVEEGQRYVTPHLPLATIEAFLKQRSHKSGALGALAALSTREREILDLLVSDYTQEEIAQQLCISPKTVDTHRSAVFRKLQVRSRFALLRFAFRHHLVYDLGGVSDRETSE